MPYQLKKRRHLIQLSDYVTKEKTRYYSSPVSSGLIIQLNLLFCLGKNRKSYFDSKNVKIKCWDAALVSPQIMELFLETLSLIQCRLFRLDLFSSKNQIKAQSDMIKHKIARILSSTVPFFSFYFNDNKSK